MADQEKQTEFKFKIPPAVTKYLKSDAPKPARMMAAQGLVPMGPAVQVAVLTFLMNDSDTEVSDAARKSILDIPINVLKNVLKEPAHPKSLDFFAHEKKEDEQLLETILLNSNTPDDTYVYLAEFIPERLTTIVANNQVRLLRKPEIAESLKKNKNALKSTLDTMISFLRINGIALEGESAELTKDEIQQILEAPEPTGPTAIPDELTEESTDDEPVEVAEQKKKTLYQLVQTMTVAQKIKLALKGNKEARSLLIKDSNKIVASSVVKSPKITDMEVLNICNMRTVQDEVIRIISNNGDWTKHYSVQFSLANNPKTPFQVALRFTRMLRVPDLLKIAKNKNVPAQISKIAKELYEQRRK